MEMNWIVWLIIALIGVGLLMIVFVMPMSDLGNSIFSTNFFTQDNTQTTNQQTTGSQGNQREDLGNREYAQGTESIICTNSDRYCNNQQSGRFWHEGAVSGGCSTCRVIEGTTECRFVTHSEIRTKEECLR